MTDEQQTTIRVGVPPSMLGQEGDDPIVVEIPSNTSPDQISKAAIVAAQMKIKAGGNEMGFTMPPSVPGGDASAMLKAFPQIAGMVASFLPAMRGVKTAFAVPAITEAGTKVASDMWSGREPDIPAALGQGVGQGILGVVGHVPGAVGRAITRGGESTVRRALHLNAPFDTREAREAIPRTAIRERASMTIPGVDKITKRSKRMGPMGSVVQDPELKQLGEALERARLSSEGAGNIQGIGTEGLLSHLVDPPKQLKIGEAMAAPFGVPGENVAQGSESIVRAILAYLASLRGGANESAPSEAQTRRRR